MWRDPICLLDYGSPSFRTGIVQKKTEYASERQNRLPGENVVYCSSRFSGFEATFQRKVMANAISPASSLVSKVRVVCWDVVVDII